ncbi:malonate transporter subunit MadL [Persicitalea jodogahamensis]|uniref:Malonate transporter MadL n=1 Tax=Persicitalea jodogahamensis TaxID=402147 RepID=A0A8J3G946_9BACT|nr:malonate transporter subunit MadL [Persicitalea jodogahamensis]GHB71656.1 malonate transporter MadL [Persicitalea jodogahamensis]
MIIYGVALLAFCYVIGQLLGEYLGQLIGVDANVGGVGFAMLLLVLLNDWLRKKNYLDPLTENGVQFWSQMYIPIIVAMAATQNVKVAVSSGLIALFAGLVPVVIGLAVIPFLSRLSKSASRAPHGNPQ